MPDTPLKLGKWRCPKCGRIIAETLIINGYIRIKCGCNEFAVMDRLSHPIDVQPIG